MEVNPVDVGLLLENLEQLLLSEDNHTKLDDEIQVEQLKNDLTFFNSLLMADFSTEQSKSFQEFVKNISAAVLKAREAIEKLLIEYARFKEKSMFKKGFNIDEHSAMLQNVLKEIQLLLNQIYDYKPIQNSPHTLATAQKPPVVEVENVVGLDEVAESIIKRLNKVENSDLDILTIIGRPGLGKTTLAKKIYNDPAIEYEFPMRAWACVSQKYSRREVYLTLLGIIKPDINFRIKSEELVAEELHTLLKNNKYLIVIDDVWTPEAWRHLRVVFPKNNKGSRIIITSRFENVATFANPDGGTHEMKFLTPKESWELLESKVFGKVKCQRNELQKLGEEVAEKCGGLPIAIVVVAGILFNRYEESKWWEKVMENLSSFNVKNEEELMELISISYTYLPYYLKSCFLYFAVFPEDYEIPVTRLIRLWIAEGFIQQGDGILTMEDIAELYLTELVNRDLLTPLKRRSNGKIRTCHVHDLFYEFCKKEGAKQNLYQEIKSPDEVTSENSRRLCIHYNVLDFIITKPQGPRVRSFFTYSRDDFFLPRDVMTVLPRSFELLRVLDIKSIVFVMFPKELLNLSLLRFLALSSNIKALPSLTWRLLNIQTFILLTKFPNLELREEIWKFQYLRHFYTNAIAIVPRPPLSATKGLVNVQSLATISPESCIEPILSRTSEIKKLGVKGQISTLFDSYFENIGNLQHLTNLKLYNDDGANQVKKLTLPPSLKFPRKLKKLMISNTMLDWEQMKILGELEELEVLKLKNNAFQGEIWEPKDGGFVSLKFLYISETNLMTWKASQHHFPSLEKLVLWFCEELVEIPFAFAEISTFQVLELYCTNSKAAASARKIQGKKLVQATKETTNTAVFKLSVYPSDMQT